MTAEFGSHDRIRHRLRYDLRPDFVSHCTKNLAIMTSTHCFFDS